jgi:hypothetical protein
MPFFARAAKSSHWLPPSQLPTFLPRIFAIVSIPVSFQVISVMPEIVKTCAMFTSFVPESRAERRLGSQSRPNCACPPATTCSGMMFGPPGLIVTSRPCCL